MHIEVMTMSENNKLYGLLAEYDSAASIFSACEKVRDAGFKKWDACTPFCVHNLDKAMGLKPSFLPWIVLCMGITGGCSALAFMLWTSVVDYPLNIGGKPLWSIPAYIPVTFEVTVLFSCLTACFGMFFICRLPMLHHPLFESERFKQVTNDKFFIVIESADDQFDLAATRALLEDSGAAHVEEVEGQL